MSAPEILSTKTAMDPPAVVGDTTGAAAKARGSGCGKRNRGWIAYREGGERRHVKHGTHQHETISKLQWEAEKGQNNEALL